MRVTEKNRLAVALLAIEEISADAQSTDPERDWKASQDAVCKIYEVVHVINAPKCRKNHPEWTKMLDGWVSARKTCKR